MNYAVKSTRGSAQRLGLQGPPRGWSARAAVNRKAEGKHADIVDIVDFDISGWVG